MVNGTVFLDETVFGNFCATLVSLFLQNARLAMFRQYGKNVTFGK